MKTYLPIGLLLILILPNLYGAVKNGYEKDIVNFKYSLQVLRNTLSSSRDLSNREKSKAKAKIKFLYNYVAYYEITDNILKQFKSISPDMFNEMDTLRNCDGKIIDVYVKFIPKEQAQFEGAGMASFEQAPNDLNSCNSEYGEGSVSVKIWSGYNTLRVLSHEFGHVKYLVPNLKTYVEFYKNKYRTSFSNFSLGHSLDDQSGIAALVFEQRFRESHARYLKCETATVSSPIALANSMKKSSVVPNGYRGDYNGDRRNLTRQRIADPYVRMLLHACEFSGTLNGESVDWMERL